MRNRKYFFILLIAGLLMASCVPQKKILYLQDIPKDDSTTAFDNDRNLDYKIQPGDNLYIKINSLDELPPLVVPGNRPYKPLKPSDDITPETDEMLCTLCECCMRVCPTAAITINDRVETDAARCIVCCACVKVCPTEARMMRDERILKIAGWLYENYSEPQEPEIFL